MPVKTKEELNYLFWQNLILARITGPRGLFSFSRSAGFPRALEKRLLPSPVEESCSSRK